MANRPLLELEVHAYLFDRGLSVPMPLGACWERHYLGYRGAFATQEVAGVHLLEYPAKHGSAMDDELHRCGKLIRAMHDLGVTHPDLQVRNILIGEEQCWLIDFDGARRHASVSRIQCARNLLRLRRSFEKNGLTPDAFRALCEGYGVDSFPRWLDRVYCLKGKVSDLASMK